MGAQPGGQGALRYDPGHDAAQRHPDWVIRHRRDLGVPEVMCPVRQVILIERGDDVAVRRCSLAHAVAHVDLAHRSQGGLITTRQEVAADRVAARRLITVRDLADAWSWAETFDEAAHELLVEPRFLGVRIRMLHPAERHFLRRLIARKEQCA